MPEEDKPPSPSWERIRSIKIDKEALAGAVGLMCLSWAALPVVYWLIVRNARSKSEHPSIRPLSPVGGKDGNGGMKYQNDEKDKKGDRTSKTSEIPSMRDKRKGDERA